VTERVLEHAAHCGEVLQATHDQPSADVLYVVKNTLYVVKIKLYASHRLYAMKHTL